MPITESELIASSDGTKPGKEDPSLSCREGRGISDSLWSPQGHIPHQLVGAQWNE